MSRKRSIQVQTPGEVVQPVDAPAQAPVAELPQAAEDVAIEHVQTPGELPDSSDVDPTKIAQPVLTKQGYVVPERG